MRGHHLNEKVDIIFISIKIHKFIVDGLCFFFFIKISISCYDETGNELGKAEDTVDNAGINKK